MVNLSDSPPLAVSAKSAAVAARVPLLRLVPGLALCAMGVLLLLAARSQPAWVGAQVGPGLMAQLMSAGVIGMGVLWTITLLVAPSRAPSSGCGSADGVQAQPSSGAALLGAVLLFGLSVPLLGLIGSASLAAILAALGAGERRASALVLTVAGLGAMTAIIGLGLLPPTAPLWPRF